jgi:endonuclease G
MKRLLSILFLVISLTTYSQKIINNIIFLDKVDKNDTIINYQNLTVCYDTLKKESHWSSYFICKSRLNGNIPRKSSFVLDPNLPKKISASLCSLKETNYDIGHLTPANDMSFSQKSMDECFYFTNVAPQYYSFNRSTWKSLENHVRELASQNDTILVMTGVIWSENKTTTCPEFSIPIPDKFWKIIYIKQINKFRYFLFPNQKCEKDFTLYEVDSKKLISEIYK